MKELKKKELMEVNGGGVLLITGIVIGTIAVAGFVKGCTDEQNKDEKRHGGDNAESYDGPINPARTPSGWIWNLYYINFNN